VVALEVSIAAAECFGTLAVRAQSGCRLTQNYAFESARRKEAVRRARGNRLGPVSASLCGSLPGRLHLRVEMTCGIALKRTVCCRRCLAPRRQRAPAHPP
jgi:hypothetical protein